MDPNRLHLEVSLRLGILSRLLAMMTLQRLLLLLLIALCSCPWISCLGLQLSPWNNNRSSEQWGKTASGGRIRHVDDVSRRQVVSGFVSIFASLPPAVLLGELLLHPKQSWAITRTSADSGQDLDLPPEAQRSYFQYRIPLQTSADLYVFELQDILQDPNEWGRVGELFQANNNRGQGIPNRIEREFTNTMRIVGLSMPPDTADEMRDAQFAFEKGEYT